MQQSEIAPGSMRKRNRRGVGGRRPILRRFGDLNVKVDRNRPLGRRSGGRGDPSAWCWGRQQGRLCMPRSSPRASSRRLGRLDMGNLGGLACRPVDLAEPVSTPTPARPRLSQSCPAAGHRQRTASAWLSHLRASAETPPRCESIREVKERIGLCEVCFNLTDRKTRCRHLPGHAARPWRDLRRGGAQAT